jgi:hypothetical protein
MAGAAQFLVPIAKYMFFINPPRELKIKFIASTDFSAVRAQSAALSCLPISVNDLYRDRDPP